MFRIGVLTLALSAAAFAQQTIPGTFTTVAPDHVVGSTLPIVTTPTMSLSNGFSPATVNMPQTLMTESPQELVTSAMPQSDNATQTIASTTEGSGNFFDYAPVSPDSSIHFGVATGPSLGTVAMRYKKDRTQAKKSYTNEDIDRMNSNTASDGIISATLANGQPIQDRNPSGFSPSSGIANMPDATNQEGTQYANGSGENTSPTMPASDTVPNQSQPNQQMPASDTNPK